MSLSNGDKLKNGKYTIVRNIGKGAYGITYEAKYKYLKNNVVIKTLVKNERHPDYNDDLKRFKREIQVLKKFLCHPNIVRIYEYFEENGRHYIVMKFLSRETLYTLVKKEGKLSELQALDYIYQIGSALKALHKSNWKHRDVHPNNIMIVKTKAKNKAILIDFGIAKNRHIRTNERPSGDERFSPYEQSHYDGFDPRFDIYALAACLYYALTAEYPEDSVDRRRGKPLTLPRKHNPHISEKVENAILKGMAIERSNRPSSIEKWLKLLPEPNNWHWWLVRWSIEEVGWSIADSLNKFFKRYISRAR